MEYFGVSNRLFDHFVLISFRSYGGILTSVTLIGSIEAPEKEIIRETQELASLIHPFLIQLTTIASTDSYYQALFVKVDPSTEVLAAYQRARKLFPDNWKAKL